LGTYSVDEISLTNNTVYELNQNLAPQQIRTLWQTIWRLPSLVAAVTFSSLISSSSHSGQFKNEAPLLIHQVGNVISDMCRSTDITHTYDVKIKSGNFLLPGHAHFDVAAAGVAHTRSLGFLRELLGGPNFDLELIWEEHTAFEFGERDVEKTMGTMVQEPYVNHIPTVRRLSFVPPFPPSVI
jgi:carboxymethylenebutenolidase